MFMDIIYMEFKDTCATAISTFSEIGTFSIG